MSWTSADRCSVTPAIAVVSTPGLTGPDVGGGAAGAPPASAYPVMRAGLPTTIAYGGTSRVTTAPAPTIAPRPMVTPGRIVAFAPIDAPFCTSVGVKCSGRLRPRGNGSLANVA